MPRDPFPDQLLQTQRLGRVAVHAADGQALACPYQKLNPGSPGEGCRVGRETGVILSEAKVLGW